MGSLEFLIQSNLHTKTQPNPLTDWFLGLMQQSRHKDALPIKIQYMGYREMFGNHKHKWYVGKNNSGEQIHVK